MITPKTAAAGISGTASTAPTTILIWLIEMIPTNNYEHHIVVPAIVAAAIGSVLAGGFAFLGSYFAPRSDPTPEQKAEILQQHAAENARVNI